MSQAMVKPAAKRPRNRDASRARSNAELESVLQMFGNTRPYSILAVGDKKWTIHFLGDTKHTIISFEGEKPVMKVEGEG